jgi:methionyl-tRNA synthetase
LLFKKIEDADVKVFREQFSGKRKRQESKSEKKEEKKNDSNVPAITFDDIQLRVARITGVEKHPNAEKLYIEKIDFGDEYRTIVSGLVGHYTPEELLNKKIIVVTNLEPAVLRGVESQGMLLAAEKNGVVGLITTHGEPGDYVYLDNLGEAKFDHIKNLQLINIKGFATVKIIVKDKKVLYDGQELRTSQGPLGVEKVDNGIVR